MYTKNNDLYSHVADTAQTALLHMILFELKYIKRSAACSVFFAVMAKFQQFPC